MLAKGRLTSLIRRLRRDRDMLKRYDDVIQDLLTKHIIEEAPPVQSAHRLHYLPHHHVISPSSTTTKLRIVYDGLTAKEIASANVWWIQHVQKQHFSTVLEDLLQNKKQHSLIRQLDLFLCSDGILRCGGRLRHADLPSTANHPILLPKEHPFTVLVIQDIHQKLQHVGTSHTLSHLRRKYWIPHGRQAVKTVLSQCLKCRRYHGPAFRMPRSPD